MKDYKVIDDIAQLEIIARNIQAADVVAVDLETSGFDEKTDYIVGFAISYDNEQGCYTPVGHRVGPQLLLEEAVGILKPALESCPTIVMHNAKFDTKFLEQNGIFIPHENIHDSMLEIFALGAGEQHFNLKDLVQQHFNHTMVKFNELFPRGAQSKNIGTILIDIVASYACEDADYTRRLHMKTIDRVSTSFIYKLERQLWPFVREVEQTGFAVDTEFLKKSAEILEKTAAELEGIIYEQASIALGYEVSFKINSTKELTDVLFNRMNLPVITKTDSGRPATSELALSKLKDRYPIVSNILALRSLRSSVATLSQTLPKFVRSDGRIHTNYNQTGATSGRFASSEPNMQNQAKKKIWSIVNSDGTIREIEFESRDVFVASPGHYLIEMDFKQIEFIVMAAEAGEESIVRAYENGLDVHANTASLVLRKGFDQISKEERNKAKVWNYLIIYGGSGYRLAQETGESEEKSQGDINRFYQTFPRLLRYSQRIQDKARITHRVCTHFGRWQLVPEYTMAGNRAASKADRAAVNRIIQGTAADIQKMGIVRANKKIAELYSRDQAQMVAQTHDSQTWEVSMKIPPQEIIPILADAMSPPAPNYPRIQVDAQIGLTWGSVEDYKESVDYIERFKSLEAIGEKRLDRLGVSSTNEDEQSSKTPTSKVLVIQNIQNSDDIKEDFENLFDAFSGEFPVEAMFTDGSKVYSTISLDLGALRDILRVRFPEAEVSEKVMAVSEI